MEATLRPTETDDWPRFLGWLYEDREGLESFFGVDLDSEQALIDALGRIVHQQANHTGLIHMAMVGDRVVGMAAITDVAYTACLGHIYIEPTSRRYSLRVGKAGLALAKTLGFQVMYIRQHKDNKAATALNRFLGFQIHNPDTITMSKEL